MSHRTASDGEPYLECAGLDGALDTRNFFFRRATDGARLRPLLRQIASASHKSFSLLSS
jgi:hypothetical protein